MEAKRKETMSLVGAESYMMFKDIKEKYGRLHAQTVQREKKELQMKQGDKFPGVPHWMSNPDFIGVEDTYICITASLLVTIEMLVRI